jgi:hypothetical protein
MDSGGKVLHFVDFQKVYEAGFAPNFLSYEQDSDHLFVLASSLSHGVNLNDDQPRSALDEPVVWLWRWCQAITKSYQ